VTSALSANPAAGCWPLSTILIRVWPESVPKAPAAVIPMAGNIAGASTSAPFAAVLYFEPTVPATTDAEMTIRSLVVSAGAPSSRTVVV
jgi:hypothetical protein